MRIIFRQSRETASTYPPEEHSLSTPLLRSAELPTTAVGLSLACILALALGLRILVLMHLSVDIDELGQIVAARMMLHGNLSGIAGQYSPPLDYLITGMLLSLGAKSIWVLRLPAMISGTVTVWLQYQLALAIVRSRATALIAALLMALSSFALFYSGWVRMYSLFLMLSTANLIAFVYYYRTRTRGWQATWFVTSVLLLYTHYFAVFLILASLLWAAGRAFWERGFTAAALHHKDFGFALVAGVLLAVSFAPWAIITVHQATLSGGVLPWGYPTAVRLFGGVFLSLSGGDVPGGSRLWLGAISLAYGLFALSGLYYLWCSQRWIATLLMVIGALPMLVLAAYTTFVGPVTTTHNLIFLLPALLVLTAIGITYTVRMAVTRRQMSWRLSTPLYAPAVAGLIVVTLLAGPGGIAAANDSQVGIEKMAEYVAAHASANDQVIPLGLPNGFLNIVYTGKAPIVAPPPTVEGFQSALQGAARIPTRCLWIVWVGQDNVYWHVGQAPNQATALERARREQVVTSALDRWATFVLKGTQITNVTPPTGVYRSCG